VVKAAIRAAAGKAAQEPPSAAGKAAQEPPSAAGKAAQEPPSAVGLRVLELPDAVAVTDLGASAQRVVVTFAADRVILTGPGGAGLAERVRDRLVDLVTHCRGAEPVYSELDFPDAGLDDSGVAALLSSMGIGPADAPSGGPEHSREPRVQT
jgi:hypothetical protein